jgi:hypothetical protein
MKHCKCGRRISLNRDNCRECVIEKLAAHIPDQAALDELFDGAPRNERAQMLQQIEPHLTFKPE